MAQTPIPALILLLSILVGHAIGDYLYTYETTRSQRASLLNYFLQRDSLEDAYQEYLVVFNKRTSDGQVDPERLEIFGANLKQALEWTEDDSVEWVAGINEMSDWTNEELGKSRFGLVGIGPTTEDEVQAEGQSDPPARRKLLAAWQLSAFNSSNPLLAKGGAASLQGRRLLENQQTHIYDYIEKLPEVGEQSCNNCWAWAVAIMAEYDWYWRTGEIRSLSESEITLCAAMLGSVCEPNSLAYGMEYLVQRDVMYEDFFIREETLQVFTNGTKENLQAFENERGKYSQCPSNFGNSDIQLLSTYERLNSTPEAFIEAIKHGPIVVGIGIGPELFKLDIGMQMYRSTTCLEGPGHAVVIVGAGNDVNEDGEEVGYWLLRNSWGKDWNGGGYFKMPISLEGSGSPFGYCNLYEQGYTVRDWWLNEDGSKRRRLQEDEEAADCKDKVDALACQDWARKGYCALSFTWQGQSVANYHCPSTCQQCPGSSEDCKDMHDKCTLWAMDGYCHPTYQLEGENVANDVCPLSCGTCAQAAAGTVDDEPCYDRAGTEKCKSWVSDGFCKPSYVFEDLSVSNYWCPLSCGMCQTGEDCVDQFTNCTSWAASGYCHEDTTWTEGEVTKSVPEWCPSSCAVPECTSGTDTGSEASQIASCFDLHYNCTGLEDNLEHGCKWGWESYSNGLYWCQATCGTCQSSDGDMAPSCVDRHPAQCPAWKSKGYCGENWQWKNQSVANVWCPVTCGTCEPEEDAGSALSRCYTKVYEVQPGDTLYGISSRFQVNVQLLRDANDLKDATGMQTGDLLTIPCAAGPAQLGGNAQGSCIPHIVQEGENFVQLTAKWGFSFSDMLNANPQIKDINDVQEGITINMPPCYVRYETDFSSERRR